jgi:hypothetical protein
MDFKKNHFLKTWIMKEYGNNESWNKLLTIPFIEDFVGLCAFNIYISPLKTFEWS